MKRDRNSLSSFARKKLLKKIVFFFAIFVFLVIFGAGLWFFRNGEFMRVINFKASGTRMVSPDEVLSFIRGDDGRRGGFWGFVLPKDHRFAYLDDASLTRLIKERFPRIKEISIFRDYSARSMSVYITERREIIIWCSVPALLEPQEEELSNAGQNEMPARYLSTSKKNCFWLDDEGLVIGEAPDSEGTLIFVVIDKSDRGVSPGKIAIPKEKLKNLIEAKKMINDFGWTVEKTMIENQLLKDMVAVISSGQNILISLERSPREEGKLILDTIIAEGKWPRVEYVDLRIEGKGFYKLR